MQVTHRPSPDAPSLTQAIIVQMVYWQSLISHLCLNHFDAYTLTRWWMSFFSEKNAILSNTSLSYTSCFDQRRWEITKFQYFSYSVYSARFLDAMNESWKSSRTRQTEWSMKLTVTQIEAILFCLLCVRRWEIIEQIHTFTVVMLSQRRRFGLGCTSLCQFSHFDFWQKLGQPRSRPKRRRWNNIMLVNVCIWLDDYHVPPRTITEVERCLLDNC